MMAGVLLAYMQLVPPVMITSEEPTQVVGAAWGAMSHNSGRSKGQPMVPEHANSLLV
jgi:hypothetical protein